MPTAKQATKFIRDLTVILVECRAFAGKLTFVAPFYGLCYTF